MVMSCKRVVVTLKPPQIFPLSTLTDSVQQKNFRFISDANWNSGAGIATTQQRNLMILKPGQESNSSISSVVTIRLVLDLLDLTSKQL